MSFKRAYRLTFALLFGMLLMVGSSQPPGTPLEQARAFTRTYEFDFFYWTLGAFGAKLSQFALGASNYLPPEAGKQIVLDYLDLISQTNQLEGQLNDIYADPNITDPEAASGSLPEQLETLRSRRKLLEPLVESVLQRQISQVVADLGLALLGQPIPPVLYHTTPPPDSLIISPRREIRQDHNIPIAPNLTAEQQDARRK
jgi:hypothetical protein